MHPWCRSTTVAHFDDKSLDNLERRARDPVTGKTMLVPASMDYKEWHDTHVKGNKEAEASFKAVKDESSDMKLFEKYQSVFGKKEIGSLAEFQKMKYTETERWKQMKAEKQTKINALDYSKEFDGKFSDIEVRQWYIAHDKSIIDKIDKSGSIEEQAKQAHSLRNTYRTQARNMMADQETRNELDSKHPNGTFEETVNRKMRNKSLTREQAIEDIIITASKTNQTVNRKFGLEG